MKLSALEPLKALPATPHVDLLLAMPRPKVMMRLWSVLAQLGLRRVVLCNAWRVEKSYFSSQATEPKKCAKAVSMSIYDRDIRDGICI